MHVFVYFLNSGISISGDLEIENRVKESLPHDFFFFFFIINKPFSNEDSDGI